MHGVLPDWCCSNRSRLIEAYQAFVGAHPDYMPGYLWLLDALLPDRRLKEARATLRALQARFTCYQTLLYEGWVLLWEGDAEESLAQLCTGTAPWRHTGAFSRFCATTGS